MTSRSLPRSSAIAAAFGAVLLAGCSPQAETTPADSDNAEQTSTTEETAVESESGSGSSYVDGTYTAEGSYSTPESVETISVTITLADDLVTKVTVSGDPQARESEEYQGQFIGGISDEVEGKDIDEISVNRVAGSSLTSGGFAEALEQIKADAKA